MFTYIWLGCIESTLKYKSIYVACDAKFTIHLLSKLECVGVFVWNGDSSNFITLLMFFASCPVITIIS